MRHRAVATALAVALAPAIARADPADDERAWSRHTRIVALADRAGATLYQVKDGGEVTALCPLPCTTDVSSRAFFRIDGPGLSTSQDFRVVSGTTGVARASIGRTATRVTGVVLMGAGGAVAGLGTGIAALALSGEQDDRASNATRRLLFGSLIVGAALVVTGLVVRAMGLTSVGDVDKDGFLPAP